MSVGSVVNNRQTAALNCSIERTIPRSRSKEKTFIEAVALYAIAKIVMLLGSLLGMLGAGIALKRWIYFAVIYSQYHDDSTWYSAIAQLGYMKGGQDTVFYPLYPLACSALAHITGMDIVTAGLVLSNALMILDILLLISLYKKVLGDNLGRFAGILWILYPMTVYLSAMYTESLFMFGIIGALLMLQDRKYVQAGIFGAIATLTRNTGVLLLIPFMYSLFQDYRRDRRLPWQGILSALAVPLALVGYFSYLWVKYGNPLIWDGMEKLWGRSFMFPLETIYKGAKALPYLWGHVGVYGHIYYVLMYGSLVLSLAALPTVYKYLPRPWFWMMLAQIVIPLCDPGTGIQTITGTNKHIIDYFFSFDRFSLTFIPLFAALAIRVNQIRLPRRFLVSIYGAGLALCGSVAVTLHMFIG